MNLIRKLQKFFRLNNSGLKFEISNFSGDKIELKQTFSILFGHIISDLKSEFRDLKMSDLKFPTSDLRLKVVILQFENYDFKFTTSKLRL